MRVQPQVPHMVVSSTYRISGVHYTYGCPTLTAALRLFPLPKKSQGYTHLYGAPP